MNVPRADIVCKADTVHRLRRDGNERLLVVRSLVAEACFLQTKTRAWHHALVHALQAGKDNGVYLAFGSADCLVHKVKALLAQ